MINHINVLIILHFLYPATLGFQPPPLIPLTVSTDYSGQYSGSTDITDISQNVPQSVSQSSNVSHQPQGQDQRPYPSTSGIHNLSPYIRVHIHTYAPILPLI